MRRAVDPPDRTYRVDDRGARQLCAVSKLRRTPILRETGRVVFCAPFRQSAIGEEPEQIVVLEPHRSIGTLVVIADAKPSRALLPAKCLSLCLGADRYEADGDIVVRVAAFELAQLRERFGEERSTDVS